MKSQFEVYLRLKPTHKYSSSIMGSVTNGMQYRLEGKNRKLEVMLPRHTKFGVINNAKVHG
jgi:kinesin family member 6/9